MLEFVIDNMTLTAMCARGITSCHGGTESRKMETPPPYKQGGLLSCLPSLSPATAATHQEGFALGDGHRLEGQSGSDIQSRLNIDCAAVLRRPEAEG